MPSMTVRVGCPLCDDGMLTATCSPDSIDDLTDDGCGHAERVWKESGQYADMLWQAVEDEAEGRRLDAEESRYSSWSDK